MIEPGKQPGSVHPSDAGAAAAPSASVSPLAALLSRHTLRDGEVVLLAIKPSFWFILLSSLWFSAIVLLAAMAAICFESQPSHIWVYVEGAIFLVAGRIMWSTLLWMGRMYVLTDMRVLRLSGVFKPRVFDCPLRKVSRTEVTRSMREKLCRTGSIEIIPDDPEREAGEWQTIARADEVNDMIQSAVRKARQAGFGAAA